MADNDLDKYLEDIGITMDEEEAERRLPETRDLEEPMPVAAAIRLEGSPRERTETFLVHLLLNLDPAYAVEITYSDEHEIGVEIFGGDPGKVIGRNGRTLAALEYVTNAVINREEGSDVRVNIDVGGYKRRRDERLRGEVRKLAERVRNSGEPVELDPMSAAERRVIHMAVADEPGVYSESTGEGRSRRVVIKPS